MNSFRAAMIATVTAFGIACSTALAAAEPPTLTVRYTDLNVESEQGAQALYARLRMASKHVCANFEGRELRQRAAWKECYDEALTKAVADLNVERLTALHHRKAAVRNS